MEILNNGGGSYQVRCLDPEEIVENDASCKMQQAVQYPLSAEMVRIGLYWMY